MSATELLTHLERLGVSLWAEGDALRFRAPTGVLDDALKARMKAEKPALLSLLRARTGEGEGAGLPPLVPEPARRLEPFALTEIQTAYWIGRLTSVAQGGVSSHYYTEVEVPGLDPERLRRALDALVARHDMLRAVVAPDGQQRVLPEAPASALTIDDVRGLPAGEVERRLTATRDRLSHEVRPADRWPLFELRLSQLDGGLWRMHLSLDLLVCDAYSALLLSRELLALYRDGAQAPAEPPPLGFHDFVRWLETARQGGAYARSLAYWKERAASLPPAPPLPVTGQQVEAPRFVRRQARLNARDWARLRQRAREAGLTPSGCLLAVYAETLRAVSQRSRFTLNLTVFHRPPVHPRINEIVGDFTSTLLVAVEDEGTTFLQRARQVQERVWRDLEHVLVNGTEVLREVRRRTGSALLMPVVFSSSLYGEDEDSNAADLLHGFGRTLYSISQTPQVLLDVQVFAEAGALLYNLDAVEALFPAGFLDTFFSAFGGLVETLAREDSAWERPGALLGPELGRWLPASPTVPEPVSPVRAAPSTAGAEQAPGTEQERAVAELFRELLGVKTLGARQNFFELGADSLMMIRAARRLSERTGREIPVVALFQNPNVTALAAYLGGGADSGRLDDARRRAAARLAARRMTTP